MSQLKRSRVRPIGYAPEADLVTIGTISVLVLTLFRESAHRWAPRACV